MSIQSIQSSQSQTGLSVNQSRKKGSSSNRVTQEQAKEEGQMVEISLNIKRKLLLWNIKSGVEMEGDLMADILWGKGLDLEESCIP